MNNKHYEIWEHPASQTWKVFTEMTQELRATLLQTGWRPVVEYAENDAAPAAGGAAGDGPQ